MWIQLILVISLTTASTFKSGYAGYVNVRNTLNQQDTAESVGYYYLEDGTEYNGDVVFSRRTPNDPRYIYKLNAGSLNMWGIGPEIGSNQYYATCLYGTSGQLGYDTYDDVRDCGSAAGFYFEYYVNAYASYGSYKLLSMAHNGYPVYTRDTTDTRYIYKAGSNWLIGRNIGDGGHFAKCDKEDLFECDWFVLCINAYASRGVYKKLGDWTFNDKEIYYRISEGDERYIYWNNQKWIISTFVTGGGFAGCTKEDIRGCDDRIDVQQCNDNDWSMSNSFGGFSDDFQDNNFWQIVIINCISSAIFTVLIILCIIKFVQKRNGKEKNIYKPVLFEQDIQELQGDDLESAC